MSKDDYENKKVATTIKSYLGLDNILGSGGATFTVLGLNNLRPGLSKLRLRMSRRDGLFSSRTIGSLPGFDCVGCVGP